MQLPRVALVFGSGLEADHTSPLIAGGEGQVQAGASTPQTKRIREFGCFSIVLYPRCLGQVHCSMSAWFGPMHTARGQCRSEIKHLPRAAAPGWAQIPIRCFCQADGFVVH
jgi:hypothetical protein